MNRYRHDQGTNKKTVEPYGLSWLDKPNRRDGPQRPLKPDHAFTPLPICLPEQAHQNPHYELICQPDPVEPTAHVGDSGLSAIMLTIGMLTILFIRKFN